MIDFDNLQLSPVANVFVFVLFIIAVAAYIVYLQIFMYKKPKDERATFLIGDDKRYQEQSEKLINAMFEREYETVTIKTYDKKVLFGRLYRGEEGAPVDICFHGYNGVSRRDFSGGAAHMLDMGHNVILVDQRGTGRSEGRCMTFGMKERFDAMAWAKYAINEFGEDVEIMLVGISMGATTVCMATELKLPDNVKGVIADCPFNSAFDIIYKVATKDRHMPAAIMYLIDLSAQLFAGFDLRNMTAARAVEKTTVPVLIIHGENDSYVPPEMSEEIQAANPKMVQRYTFPGANHGTSYLHDPERYKKLVSDFFEFCGVSTKNS
ncbi:MAG: alpha/beta hydrolase [Firmicutes bacterium]|nr:alpha/beta hydrolase [Bacillota bacterium]